MGKKPNPTHRNDNNNKIKRTQKTPQPKIGVILNHPAQRVEGVIDSYT